MVENQRGLSNHIFMGHGTKTENFERREFATTNNLVYEKKETTEQIISPSTFQSDEGKRTSTV